MSNHSYTGSGELPSALFIEGTRAGTDLNVPVRNYAGPCPNCKIPLNVTLSFNPTDSYYYICFCPSCLKTIRYCDFDGNLADFKIMTTSKSTPLDQDLDVTDRYNY